MLPLENPLIAYDMVSTVEKIGPFPIHLWAIRDMDEALDHLCSKYQPETPEEQNLLLDLCPYFATIWPAARGLARLIAERKSDFNKRSGVEVGCGLGLPSILASKVGATMLASDFHPDVPHWLKQNADLNGVKIEYLPWNFSGGGHPERLREGSFDFVLASDVLYEKDRAKDLALSLSRLIHPSGKIYLSDPGRAYLSCALDEFERLGYSQTHFSYEVEESGTRPELRLEKQRTIQIFEFSR